MPSSGRTKPGKFNVLPVDAAASSYLRAASCSSSKEPKYFFSPLIAMLATHLRLEELQLTPLKEDVSRLSACSPFDAFDFNEPDPTASDPWHAEAVFDLTRMVVNSWYSISSLSPSSYSILNQWTPWTTSNDLTRPLKIPCKEKCFITCRPTSSWASH